MKTDFQPEDFEIFDDPRDVMHEVFGVACSVCGFEEIGFVAVNGPKPIGQIAEEVIADNADVTDEELSDILEAPIEAWQEFDDYNAEHGIPTFTCDSCYAQLINGEIQISNIEEDIAE